jgi:uncharacterized protein (DUF1778 family)
MSLTHKQRQAIAALLSCRTVDEAAASIGVADRTLHRWLNDPVFAAALNEAEGQAISLATRRLVNLTDSAIDTLAAVLDDPSATTTHKLRAANTVLEAMLKLRELRNIEERLAALERQINGQAKF